MRGLKLLFINKRFTIATIIYNPTASWHRDSRLEKTLVMRVRILPPAQCSLWIASMIPLHWCTRRADHTQNTQQMKRSPKNVVFVHFGTLAHAPPVGLTAQFFSATFFPENFLRKINLKNENFEISKKVRKIFKILSTFFSIEIFSTKINSIEKCSLCIPIANFPKNPKIALRKLFDDNGAS